jgi:hypothetical protein
MEQLESYVHGGRRHSHFDVQHDYTAKTRTVRDPLIAKLEGASGVAQKQAAINQVLERSLTELPHARRIRLFFADSVLETVPVIFPEQAPVSKLIYTGPALDHAARYTTARLRDQLQLLGELAESIRGALSSDGSDFDELAADWKYATRFVSSPEEIAMHPSYQRIIGMGQAALPRILSALKQQHDQWFWALRAIVGHDVAQNATTIAEAAGTWVDWGKSLGLLADADS